MATRQAGVLTQLTDARRLSRISESQSMDPANAYPLGDYLADLRVADLRRHPDANRRTLQRVYLERLAALMDPPAAHHLRADRAAGAAAPTSATAPAA